MSIISFKPEFSKLSNTEKIDCIKGDIYFCKQVLMKNELSDWERENYSKSRLKESKDQTNIANGYLNKLNKMLNKNLLTIENIT